MRLFRLLIVLIAAGFAGCATTEKPKEDRVSSIPWAKPESWEGQGAFGSMMQGSR